MTGPGVLLVIRTQEKLGCKQVAVVLPNPNKAFQRPVDFDDLKVVRPKLQVNVIFIATPGPALPSLLANDVFPSIRRWKIMPRRFVSRIVTCSPPMPGTMRKRGSGPLAVKKIVPLPLLGELISLRMRRRRMKTCTMKSRLPSRIWVPCRLSAAAMPSRMMPSFWMIQKKIGIVDREWRQVQLPVRLPVLPLQTWQIVSAPLRPPPRQGNGTDLLGVNDPRAASIGIIYVAPANDWTKRARRYPDAG